MAEFCIANINFYDIEIVHYNYVLQSNTLRTITRDFGKTCIDNIKTTDDLKFIRQTMYAVLNKYLSVQNSIESKDVFYMVLAALKMGAGDFLTHIRKRERPDFPISRRTVRPPLPQIRKRHSTHDAIEQDLFGNAPVATQSAPELKTSMQTTKDININITLEFNRIKKELSASQR